MKTKITIAVITVILLATGAIFAKKNNGHPANWSPKEISIEATAGTTTTQVVTLTAGDNLDNITLRIVPELQKVLSISPDRLSLSKGESANVTLSVTPEEDTDPETIYGTIHVQPASATSTLSKPLPITLNIVWPKVESEEGGFSISYPGRFEQSTGEIGILPSGRKDQFLSFQSDEGDFTLDWENGYPSGTPIDEWADQDEWPTSDGDWHGLYVLTTLNGREVLQDPETGTAIVAVEDRVYYIFNGIGPEPTYVPLNEFQRILETLQFSN